MGGMTEPQCCVEFNEMPTLKEASERRLIDAVKRGEVADGKKGMGVKSLIESRVDINCTDSGGNTPLHYASSNNQLEVAMVLLANTNINPNLQDAYGRTALHLAACCGHLDMVKLLRSNAKVSTQIKNHLGKTPHDLAQAAGFKECAAALDFR
eukprot:GGOE01039832.1.p1 GENE.GGOE01039832.1~~GGOE01039832.1.p1  ORF type:complete len:153 (+),score=28.67 GGOE01039832.1:181-639(+)